MRSISTRNFSRRVRSFFIAMSKDVLAYLGQPERSVGSAWCSAFRRPNRRRSLEEFASASTT